MKLAELQKSAAPASQGAVTPEPVASPAPPEPQSVIPGQMTVDECIAEVSQGITNVTPSDVEIQYEWAPRRLYRLNGQEAPSVTTVLGVLDKPQLVWWGMKTGVEGVLELNRRNVLVAADFSPDAWDKPDAWTTESIVEALTREKLTCNHQKNKAADRGVNVHGALETWAKDGIQFHPDDYPEHERGYIEGLISFLLALQNDVSDVQTELMVGSLQHHYAGRFDLVLTLDKPIEVVTRAYPKKPSRIEEIPAGRVLIDLKTSKNVYPTHYLQLEAYEAAAVECGYPPTDYRAVLHVTADGRYELALNKDWMFEDFLAVRQCYSVMNERSVIQALRDELDAKEVK